MNILIVGCGRTGRRLVPALRARGHQVAVLDRDAQALEELVQEGFDGPTIHGPAIDADALHQAGVESCGAVLAVTGQDDGNLMVAQMAKELFGVPQAIARVEDPARSQVYGERFGLELVCSTELTADALLAKTDPNARREPAAEAPAPALPPKPHRKKPEGPRVCIVGGGKVGFHLARALLERGQMPVLIERDEGRCARLANQLELPVLCGDGTSPQVLEAAGCRGAAALVAVTGQDEANLIACQLAKKQFEVPRTAARVNNPKNTASLKKLGADITMCSTEILTRLLEREVETSALRHVMSLSGGQADLTEVLLPTDFALAGQTLTQALIPPEVVLVSITRNERLLIPRGGTVLLPGDRVLCLARDEGLRQLMRDWKLEEKR